jgi:hypothetical protein
MSDVKAAIDLLRGAVTIVYPMGLPPHDPIRMEFEDKEDLEGTQVRKYKFQESEQKKEMRSRNHPTNQTPQPSPSPGIKRRDSERHGDPLVGGEGDSKGKETLRFPGQK